MTPDTLPPPDYVQYMLEARRARSLYAGEMLGRALGAIGRVPQRAWAFASRRLQNERGKPSTCSAT
jgi:hypothetical protein